MAQPIDVFFRGDRPYIQGSLVLSQAARIAFDGFGDGFLVSAKFSQIITCGVEVAPSGEGSGEAFGEAQFRTVDGERHKLEFFACKAVEPPRRPDRGSTLTSFSDDGNLNASAAFSIAPELDDLLAAVVETTKKAHERLPASVYDVWFTGFRGAHLPLNADLIPQSGQIVIENRVRRGDGGSYQTLFNARIESAAEAHEFLLSFAYRVHTDENEGH